MNKICELVNKYVDGRYVERDIDVTSDDLLETFKGILEVRKNSDIDYLRSERQLAKARAELKKAEEDNDFYRHCRDEIARDEAKYLEYITEIK